MKICPSVLYHKQSRVWTITNKSLTLEELKGVCFARSSLLLSRYWVLKSKRLREYIAKDFQPSLYHWFKAFDNFTKYISCKDSIIVVLSSETMPLLLIIQANKSSLYARDSPSWGFLGRPQSSCQPQAALHCSKVLSTVFNALSSHEHVPQD